MSDNSESSRPVSSIAFPREMLDRLKRMAKEDENSVASIVNRAVTLYFHTIDSAQITAESSAEAARYLMDHKESYLQNVIRTSQDLEQVTRRVEDVGRQVNDISRTLEVLFGVRLGQDPTPLSREHYEQEKAAALSEYAAEPEIISKLKDRIISSNVELRRAASHAAFTNRKDEVEKLLNSMDFMSDSRFYVVYHTIGPALFDREFPSFPEEAGIIDKGHFKVFETSISGNIALRYPDARPYFKTSATDERDTKTAYGIEEVARAASMIVADYLAFRQFNRIDGNK